MVKWRQFIKSNLMDQEPNKTRNNDKAEKKKTHNKENALRNQMKIKAVKNTKQQKQQEYVRK